MKVKQIRPSQSSLPWPDLFDAVRQLAALLPASATYERRLRWVKNRTVFRVIQVRARSRAEEAAALAALATLLGVQL